MGTKVINMHNEEPTLSYRLQLLPRLIRHRDAAAYLGIERHKFDSWVRPQLTEFIMSRQTVCFDRLELDAWVDHLKKLLTTGECLEKPVDEGCAKVKRKSVVRKTQKGNRKASSVKEFDKMVKLITQEK
jgi:hypothetical protein